MSELREVEYNPFTGETKKWYFDDENNIVCKKSVDLSKLIDHCKEQEAVVKGFSEKLTKFHHVFHLPHIVIEKITPFGPVFGIYAIGILLGSF